MLLPVAHHLGGREIPIVTASAARDGGDLGRALNLLEVEVRVVRIGKPVKPPEASLLEGLGHLLALFARAHPTILGPGDTAVLRGAAVEEADAAAGHEDVEVIVGDVAAGVGGLDDHGLAGDGAVGESQAAECRLSVLVLYLREVLNGKGIAYR